MPVRKVKKKLRTAHKKSPQIHKKITLFSITLIAAATIGIAAILYFSSSHVTPTNASYDSASKLYTASFDGNPDAPAAYSNIGQNEFDLAIHSRDSDTWDKLHVMEAHHGGNCSAPIDSNGAIVMHTTSGTYEDAVFKCKDHVMTSMNEEGYGVIYLTPSYTVGISDTSTKIKFDVSTYRSSSRDWIDLWLTPYENNMQLPLDSWLPDLQGTPKNAIHIKEDQGIFKVYVIKDYKEREITKNIFETYDTVLSASPKDRATFELEISKNHVKFGLPAQPLTSNKSIYWADSDIDDLGFTDAVLQLGHHSYNPTKDCNVANTPGPDGTCKPNTWHWDNINMTNATPFTLIKSDKRRVTKSNEIVTFQEAAPENSYLRFSAWGTVDLSFDNGTTWTKAARAEGSSEAEGNHHPEHASSYFTPIPTGTTSVMFKFSGDGWYSGFPYAAKDFSVWSKTITSKNLLGEPTQTPSETPTATLTMTLTPTPTPSPMVSPSPTNTPLPTAVPNTTTVSKTITQGTYDTSLTGNSFNINSNTITLGKDGSTGVKTFNTFSNLSIPENAVIVDARLNYELAGYGGDTINVVVRAQDTGNATTPASKTQFIAKQKNLTSASVIWNKVQKGDWGTKIKSPNISSLIQEIVDRTDWKKGNTINLWVGDNKSTNWANVRYFSGDFTGAGQKPTLTVTYHLP